MMRTVEFSNENLVSEMRNKITLLNQMVENKDREFKIAMENYQIKEKKNSKKKETISDSKIKIMKK
jgi:hypothetical protein